MIRARNDCGEYDDEIVAEQKDLGTTSNHSRAGGNERGGDHILPGLGIDDRILVVSRDAIGLGIGNAYQSVRGNCGVGLRLVDVISDEAQRGDFHRRINTLGEPCRVRSVVGIDVIADAGKIVVECRKVSCARAGCEKRCEFLVPVSLGQALTDLKNRVLHRQELANRDLLRVGFGVETLGEVDVYVPFFNHAGDYHSHDFDSIDSLISHKFISL